MKTVVKIKRSFYSRPYPEAMRRAKAYASQHGAMDWSVYLAIMARYEKINARKRERETVFAEQLPLFRGAKVGRSSGNRKPSRRV